MSFSVVIATYRRPKLLERTLRSLADARKPAGFERVIVVENGSPDGARDVCERLAGALSVEYHHHPQPGKGRAVQWMLERVQKGFVLFLDDDIRVGNDLLERYADAIQRYGCGHFFGGSLEIDYEVEPANWLRHYLPRSAKGWRPADPQHPFQGHGRFLGTNFGAFADEVLIVGGFRPDIGPGALHAGTEGNPTGLEFDLQDRMLDHGYLPVYVEGAEVWHFVPRERCSETWALDRIFRNGVSRTFRQPADGSTRDLRLWRVPVAAWLRYILAALRAALAPLVPGAELRFRLKYTYNLRRGNILGYRLGRRG